MRTFAGSVEVFEEGFPFFFQLPGLLAHEFAGEIIPGLVGAHVLRLAEIHGAAVVLQQLLIRGFVRREKVQVLTARQLPDLQDLGHHELPEKGRTHAPPDAAAGPEGLGAVVGHEVGQLHRREAAEHPHHVGIFLLVLVPLQVPELVVFHVQPVAEVQGQIKIRPAVAEAFDEGIHLVPVIQSGAEAQPVQGIVDPGNVVPQVLLVQRGLQLAAAQAEVEQDLVLGILDDVDGPVPALIPVPGLIQEELRQDPAPLIDEIGNLVPILPLRRQPLADQAVQKGSLLLRDSHRNTPFF